jgi:hypothetical protein
MHALNDSTGIRPWHWLSILSLDAPAVALVWQEFFARTTQVPVGASQRLVLGLSVWLAYMADRWLDGRMLPAGAALTNRHRFAQRHAASIAGAWVMVFLGTLLIAAIGLSSREFFGGLILAAVVLAYLAACHVPAILRRLGWLKELAVSLLFSGGAAVFVFARLPALKGWHWAGLAWMAGACALNCALVSIWERPIDARLGQPSLAVRFNLPLRGLKFAAAAFLALAVAIGWSGGNVPLRGICSAAGLSSAGVLLLACRGGGIELETRRLLADATLLSPLLVWWHS